MLGKTSKSTGESLTRSSGKNWRAKRAKPKAAPPASAAARWPKSTTLPPASGPNLSSPRPLQIQLQKRRQQIVIAHLCVPAVGGEYCAIEPAVRLLEPSGLMVVEVGL